MKQIKNISFFAIMLGFLVCCQSKDSYYFNGVIRYIDASQKIVRNVTCKSVSLDGIYTGMIAAYDSLFICWHPGFSSHFFNVFNIDTGEQLGSFCEKGRGPKEAISVNCIYQLFKKGNDIISLLYASNEGKLFFWNISQSIEREKTVYDTVVPYHNNSIQFHFYQSEDTLLAFKASDFLDIATATTPFYEKRTIYSNELIKEYPIYKMRSVQNMNTEWSFYTWDVIKPDGSKVAQAMQGLPQINILDINTGNIVGFRMRNGPNFSLIETGTGSMNAYYHCLQADDNYIYASYWGKGAIRGRIGDDAPLINTIHVFDWNGKLLHELIADRPFYRSMWLDQIRNRLYSMDIDTDELYYLDLAELVL